MSSPREPVLRFGPDEWLGLSGPEKRAFDRWLSGLTGRHPSSEPRVRAVSYLGPSEHRTNGHEYRLEVEVLESRERRALLGRMLFEELEVSSLVGPILLGRWARIEDAPVLEAPRGP